MTDDTPPGVYSASVRGNLLDLERNWLLADSPASPYTPRPAHLEIVWADGLPYWSGLLPTDLVGLHNYMKGVGQLLSVQRSRLKWSNKGPALFADPRCANYPPLDAIPGRVEAHSKESPLYPAYHLVSIPPGLSLRWPRYAPHIHTPQEESSHPAVVESWPVGPDRAALRDFVVEALMAEGVAAWVVLPGSILVSKFAPTDYDRLMAVVATPWFGSSLNSSVQTETVKLNTRAALLSSQTEATRHVAIALAKLDFHFV